MLTRKVRLTLKDANGMVALDKEITLTADGAEERSVAIDAETSDVLIALALDKDKLALFYMVCDQDVTVVTNSAEGVDSFTLAADVPMLWYTGCGAAVPFSVDVTALYASNVGLVAAQLDLVALVDATP